MFLDVLHVVYRSRRRHCVVSLHGHQMKNDALLMDGLRHQNCGALLNEQGDPCAHHVACQSHGVVHHQSLNVVCQNHGEAHDQSEVQRCHQMHDVLHRMVRDVQCDLIVDDHRVAHQIHRVVLNQTHGVVHH